MNIFSFSDGPKKNSTGAQYVNYLKINVKIHELDCYVSKVQDFSKSEILDTAFI